MYFISVRLEKTRSHAALAPIYSLDEWLCGIGKAEVVVKTSSVKRLLQLQYSTAKR